MTAMHIIGLVADAIIIGAAIGVGIVNLRAWSKRFSNAIKQAGK